jgi:ABC-2 type transport system permease protein
MNPVVVVFRKEVASFFNSLIAYLVLSIFLVGIGLFFWVFEDNVFDQGTAQLDILFSMAPWFFLFLVPAITMRFFSEEIKTGTLEFLATKPITDWQILLGKYLAAVWLLTLSLLPTLIYYISLGLLALPAWNLDTGAIMGAYLGLVGIGAVFCAIGVFSSSLTDSQIVAFLYGVLLCFTLFAGFDSLAQLAGFGEYNDTILQLGILEHYRSISRGVVDSRDVLYYLTLIFFFLFLTYHVLVGRRG